MNRVKRESPTVVTGDKNKFELVINYWVEESDLMIEATVYPKANFDVTTQQIVDIDLVFTDPDVGSCREMSKRRESLNEFVRGSNFVWAEHLTL